MEDFTTSTSSTNEGKVHSVSIVVPPLTEEEIRVALANAVKEHARQTRNAGAAIT